MQVSIYQCTQVHQAPRTSSHHSALKRDALLLTLLCAMQMQAHPGEISAAVLPDLRAVLATLPVDDDAFLASWFGRFISTPRGLPAAEPRDPPLKLSELRRRFSVRYPPCRACGPSVVVAVLLAIYVPALLLAHMLRLSLLRP